jgi:hypothetical protein
MNKPEDLIMTALIELNSDQLILTITTMLERYIRTEPPVSTEALIQQPSALLVPKYQVPRRFP